MEALENESKRVDKLKKENILLKNFIRGKYNKN